MADLTTRLDDIEALMTTQHDALITTLEATNALLTQVVNGLWFESLGTPTPWLSLLQTISDTETGSNTVLYNSYLEQVAINTKLATALTRLADIVDATQLTSSIVTDVSTSLGIVGTDADGPALTLLENIERHTSLSRDVLGVKTGDQSTTVSGYLALIAENSSCACGDVAVDLTGCADPTFSCGIQFIPAIVPFTQQVHVARWCEPLPTGVTYGTTFGIVETDLELENDDGFSTWHMYVQSSAPTFAVDPTGLDRYPTNTWLTMPNVDNISFSVDAPHSLVVTICPTFASICDYEDAVFLYQTSEAAPFTTPTVAIDGFPYIWFASSSDPYNIGVAELWVDDVLVETIDPIPASGINIVRANTGLEAYVTVSGTTAAYVAIKGCPEFD